MSILRGVSNPTQTQGLLTLLKSKNLRKTHSGQRKPKIKNTGTYISFHLFQFLFQVLMITTSLQPIFPKLKAESILSDCSHPLHQQFQLLPSGLTTQTPTG